MGRGGSSCVADARFYALRSNAGNLPPHGPLPPPTWITQWAPDNELQNVNVQRVMTLASATETAFLRARPVAAREEERRALGRLVASMHALRLVLLSTHHTARQKYEAALQTQIASYTCGARWPVLELDAKAVTNAIMDEYTPKHTVTPGTVLLATAVVASCATVSLPAALLVSAMFLLVA